MQKVIFLFLLILMSAQLPVQGQAALALNTREAALLAAKADSILAQAIQLGDAPGIVAGIAYQGETIWTGAAGHRDLANDQPATPAMLHRIASITKPMTAIAIMQLVEQGRIDLDRPIQDYLPDYPRSTQGDITVRHLLQHTAGIPFYKNKKEGFPKMHFETLTDAVALFKDRPLLHEPGTAYQYTTYGYTLLGAILEAVTGETYANYMKANVWGPAGMPYTRPEIFGERYPNQSKLYKTNRRGHFVPDRQTDLSLKYPGGGLLSTVPDLLQFGEAVLDNKLVSAKTLTQMQQAADVEWQGTPYGMGWYVFDDPEFGRVIRHGGRQSGTNTYLAIFLKHKLVVALIANNFNMESVYSIHRQLAERTLDPSKRAEPLRKALPLSRKAVQPILGQYQFGDGQILKIRLKRGQLYTRMSKYPKLRIYPMGNDSYFYRNLDAHFDFTLNDQQKVTKVMYTQHGRSFEVQKLK